MLGKVHFAAAYGSGLNTPAVSLTATIVMTLVCVG